ncbi:MAG TPA: cellulase family glycosylhydrolase [Cyclobacteriaceae bacterium]|nr:cellulase family glycosylhydrolase [Cyclobacteriaceae bacterium]
MKKLNFLFYFFALIMLASCNDAGGINTLTVDPVQATIGVDGGTSKITIQTNASSWSITNSASDWLSLSSTSGTGHSGSVTLTVSTRTLESRTATLVVSAGSAKPVELSIVQTASNYLYVIKTDLTTLSFDHAGGVKALKITTDASTWSISSDADWLQFSQTTGSSGTISINITATESTSDNAKTGTISITADNAATVQISVTQKAPLYPSYNTSPLAADATGMSSTAVELAAKINLGWNIGNSLEAIGGETFWGNPKVTKALIDLVKQNGFNAVRIPCSWNQYSNSTTGKISDTWLARVKEVVQYCIDNDMYVLLNIHWDGGWLENNCTTDKQVENNAKQKAFWEQIATEMRDFDEHLLFASANEPNVDNATQMTVLTSYHQTFINAVRSTGGHNTYRVLVVQGPRTDIQKTNDLMNTLPTDPTANRMMAEVHYYTPYQFCLMTKDESWGNMFYYWGQNYHSTTDATRNATWGEETDLNNFFKMMKTKFVDKGIPVVLGEYAAIRRTSLTGDNLTLHLASRAYFLKYLIQQAKANGILPFYWDAGGIGDGGTGLFDRSNNTVADQTAIDALVQGAQ